MNMADPRKILILGHNGFIGSHLSSYLDRHASMEVVGRSLPSVDLTRQENCQQLSAHLDKDTVLIILAAVKRQFGDSLSVYMQNMEITRNIADLIEANPVQRVIYFSSAAVYGEETENLDISEETEVNPTSFYGIAKYSSECVLRKICRESEVSLVCLRPPLIYGQGDQGRTYGPSGFSQSAMEAEQITLWGDGNELREFIYIEDVCRIIERLVSRDTVPAVLNVASGNRYTFSDVIDVLRKEFPDLKTATRERSKDKVDNAFDPTLLRSICGEDFSFTGLEKGIKAIIHDR